MAPPGIHGLPNPAGRGTVAFIGERYPMPYREITSPQLWLVSPDGAERQLGSGAERVGFAGAVYGGATARAYYVAQNGVPRRGAPAALWELDLAAGTERMRFEFTSGACCMAGETAAISPDGLRVAYITDVGLRVRELEGGADFAIANDDTSTCVNDGECGRLRLPEWSVDGRYIRATLPTQEARQTIFRFVWKETPGTPPRAVARAQAAAAACQEYLCSVAPSGAALQFGTARARNEVTSPHHPPIIRRIYDATGAPRGTFEYDVPGAGLTHETLTPVTWLPDGSAVVVLKYENSYPPKLTWFLYNLDAVAQPLPIAVDSVLMAY